MTDEHVSMFSLFAQALNRELAERRCEVTIAACEPDRLGWMMLLDSVGNEIGAVPDDVSAEAICAFVEILTARASVKERTP